jgi:hypothetical protein
MYTYVLVVTLVAYSTSESVARSSLRDAEGWLSPSLCFITVEAA